MSVSRASICLNAFGVVVLIVIICAIYLNLPPDRTSVVQLEKGKVRGIVQNVGLFFYRKSVNFYQGIRYGKANRFEKPRPVEPWAGIYDADSYRDACPQFGQFEDLKLPFTSITSSQSEDCLYLNVWQPLIKTQKLLPVMVWIHGGGFEIGTIFTTIFDGKYLAQQGSVIVVSVNYRLGPLGFLYAGNQNLVPENLGLRDQILALKWVQENIHNFGGDPNAVTIFGESAGSVSVGALLLSPLTKGLFHRAIMQSGAPIAKILFQPKDKIIEMPKLFASRLDCPIDDDEKVMDETIDCLKHNRTVNQMQSVWSRGFMRNEFFFLVYGDEVLPVNPIEALNKSEFPQRAIDLLYGVNRDEGSLFALELWSKVVPENLTIESAKQEMIKTMKYYSYSQENATQVANFYAQRLAENSTQDNFKSTIGDVWGDYHLTCPTILFAEQYAKSSKSPTNRYFAYRLMQPVEILGLFSLPAWMGVSHAQDLFYLFMKQLAWFSSASHYQLSLDMIDSCTHFAKFGYPGKIGGVKWEKAFKNQKNTQYMHLERGKYTMVSDYFVQTCNDFWKNKILN